MYRANTFETGIAPGTLITQANSDDGAAGDGFAGGVGQGAGGSSVAFDNAQAAHGTLSGKFVQAASPATIFVAWSHASLTDVYGRFYYYATAHPANEFNVLQYWSAAISGTINVRTDSVLAVQDSTFTNRLVATNLGALTLNAWNRVEFLFHAHPSTGFITLKQFLGDSTVGTGTGTDTSSNGNFGSDITTPVFGMNAVAASHQFWLDDLQVNDSNFPGPVSGVAWLKA